MDMSNEGSYVPTKTVKSKEQSLRGKCLKVAVVVITL